MLKVKVTAISAIILSFVFSVAIMSFSSAQERKQNLQTNQLKAEHIYDSIHTEILKPITISRTMAIDSLLHTLLCEENAYSEEEMEKIMADYLSIIRDKMGYIAAFVISEQTHRYYTPKGITKIVNPKTSPYDIWYQLFLESGKEYDLDTDRDQSNGYRWTVFVNVRIIDKTGKLLGVCGVGLFMDNLQEMLENYEVRYKVKINLIDPEGLVQVDADSANIENAYIVEAILDKPKANTFSYAKRGLRGFRLTRYMEDLEWFLVVQGNAEEAGLRIMVTLMLVVSCLMLIGVFLIVMHFVKLTEQRSVLIKDEEDPLTGLPNRNYFKEAYGELGVFNTTRYKSLVVFDVDRFKILNDMQDGDAILRNMIIIVREVVEGQGLLLRWGGDEFVVLMEIQADEAEKEFKAICTAVKEKLDITMSVGIVEVNLSDRIKTNYYRAVQLCYAAKESGGNGVRRQ